ncbi:MAG: transglycosylase domain-containing protein [Desulfamplus sp.]|nr:transglycosylase domain-containing protein [Desulfamplus sp.]
MIFTEPLSKLIMAFSIIVLILISTAVITVCSFTRTGIKEVPDSLKYYLKSEADIEHKNIFQLFDRNGVPLNTIYLTKWNYNDIISLHQIPQLLQQIFILSEDQSFYQHHGIDWRARLYAIIQNMRAGKVVRGASTITEQVVRMIHPRKRTLWSRWIEGFEAVKLEKSNTKADILEFYLNQIPYASNRRGVVQAARFYFDRSLDTLNLKEMFALATLVRAPSSYNLYKAHSMSDKTRNENSLREFHINYSSMIDKPLNLLVNRAISKKIITSSQWEPTKEMPFDLKSSNLSVEAPHFVKHVYYSGANHIRTTLDGALQNRVNKIVITALKNNRKHKAANGALLIAKNHTGEIAAWVSASTESSTKHIDAVKSLRQPGSAMKPFLYALALEKGWSAATIIDDSPLNEAVGLGVHTYHNYSNIHYGPVTLRNALGNSLNIPAVKTIRFTGVGEYLEKLKQLGITTLNRHPDFYGDGLALGNGEVSLYDMVQAYSVFANAGKFIPLTCFYDYEHKKEQFSDFLSPYSKSTSVGARKVMSNLFKLESEQIFSKEISSIIGNILSDSGARSLEFGDGDLLNFPVQTAVKTGTSSDYRDAWAMGYNSNYTVGVWMGNLDGSPTVELTGSRGPAFVLRSVFAELNHIAENYGGKSAASENPLSGNRPLYMSPNLIKKDISISTKESNRKSRWSKKTEWFISNTEPFISNSEVEKADNEDKKVNRIEDDLLYIVQNPYMEQNNRKNFGFVNPFNGLQVAMDPRIPDELEYMEFKVRGVLPQEQVRWFVDGEPLHCEKFKNDTIQWKVEKGEHEVYTELINKASNITAERRVGFWVK